jgi:hypothetical protein
MTHATNQITAHMGGHEYLKSVGMTRCASAGPNVDIHLAHRTHRLGTNMVRVTIDRASGTYTMRFFHNIDHTPTLLTEYVALTAGQLLPLFKAVTQF